MDPRASGSDPCLYEANLATEPSFVTAVWAAWDRNGGLVQWPGCGCMGARQMVTMAAQGAVLAVAVLWAGAWLDNGGCCGHVALHTQMFDGVPVPVTATAVVTHG